MQASDLLTAQQIADTLGVNVVTIRAAFAAGELPGRKAGRSWVTTDDAVRTWLLTGNARRDRRATDRHQNGPHEHSDA